MGTTIEKYIIAIVTINKEQVFNGGAPMFVAENEEQLQKTAFLLEKILDGMAHDLNNGTMIIVRH